MPQLTHILHTQPLRQTKHLLLAIHLKIGLDKLHATHRRYYFLIMGSSKEANLYHGVRADEDQAPPAYEPGVPGPSTVQDASTRPNPAIISNPTIIPGPSTVSSPSPAPGTPLVADPSSSQSGEKSGQPAGPTVDAPFNFPSDAPPPSYSPSGSSKRRPIAIPQASPSPASPFLPLYPPSLLNYGITEGTWASFLDTLSGFLAAKVSARAVSHAADMGRRFTETHKNAAKGVMAHAKAVGKGIGRDMKRGNVIGAAMGVIGGTVSIPVSAAMGAVGSAVRLPGSAVAAVAKKPQTPQERAVAYLAVANNDWFFSRGLRATLMGSHELSELVGAPIITLAEAARDNDDESVERQLGSLEEHIEKLEVRGPSILTLGPNTMWLVLTEVQGETW